MASQLAHGEKGAKQGGFASLEGGAGAVVLVVQHQLGEDAEELAETILHQGVVVAHLVHHLPQAADAALYHL